MGGGSADPTRRTSAPAVSFEAPKARGGDSTRETERAREVLGQAVASQNKIEQLQEEGRMYVCGSLKYLTTVCHYTTPHWTRSCYSTLYHMYHVLDRCSNN